MKRMFTWILVLTALLCLPLLAAAEETPISDFEWILNDDGGVTITKYTGNGGDVVIPAQIDGKPVTKIGDEAFRYCYDLTSVILPDSVTSIGDSAFSSCSSLTSVTIPDSVTSIGEYTFCYCYCLTSITIPDSVTSIARTAFNSCNNLIEVNASQRVLRLVTECGIYIASFIAEEAPASDFEWDANDDGGVTITKYVGNGGAVVIPAQIDGKPVTRIGASAFENCNYMPSVIIPDGVTSIGDSAFYGCDNLTSITIPDSMTSIEDSAFFWCEDLASITIPNSVTFIGDGAFSACYNLTSVTIQNPDIQLGYYVFPHALSLQGQDLVFPEGGRYICTASGFLADLAGEHGVTIVSYIGREDHELVIPSQINGQPVTTIGSYAFESSDAESIIIPDGVTSICTHAFDYCFMESITIPDSVTSIADAAFFDCISLHTINASEKVRQMAENAIASDL